MNRCTFPFDKRPGPASPKIFFSSIKDHQNNKERKSLRNDEQKRNANALRNQVELIPVIRKNRITQMLSPREKVQKVLRIFKIVYEELVQQNAAKSGDSKTSANKIHYDTRNILMGAQKHVNVERRIGTVPGTEVGDEFQYKSELNLIGLHFAIQGGIDYMDIGDMILATSIVVSEDNGYNNSFKLDVVIYCGQGGKVTITDHILLEDQRFVTGNLALANSMREKSVVRVIRGKKSLDNRRKRYVYVGLYLVEDFWLERGHGGYVLFKFKLCRIPGQPFVDLEI